MRPSLTAMSSLQPLLHSKQAEGTQESMSSTVTPSIRCWSTRTGQDSPGERPSVKLAGVELRPVVCAHKRRKDCD